MTPGKEHDKNIYWEDTSVALLGNNAQTIKFIIAFFSFFFFILDS